MFVSRSSWLEPLMQSLSPSTGYAAVGMCLALVVPGVQQGCRPPVLRLEYNVCALALVGVSLRCCKYVGCEVSSSSGFYACGFCVCTVCAKDAYYKRAVKLLIRLPKAPPLASSQLHCGNLLLMCFAIPYTPPQFLLNYNTRQKA